MTQDQLFQLLLVLIPTLPALYAAITAMVNRREIKSLHVIVNSRLDELLHVSKVAAHQKGVVEGQAIEQALALARLQPDAGPR